MSDMLDPNKSILLVEDDEIDVMTVKRAARKIDIENQIDHAGNGEEAIEYLENSYPKVPSIIIMDINMPRMNGLELLEVIKKDSRFKRIPVIVLTTSKEEQDRYRSFDLSVAGYMVKPVDFNNFLDVMTKIKEYWTLSQFTSQ